MSDATTEVSPEQAEAAVAGGEATLLDVRETWEWEEVHIPGAVLIPMNEIPTRLDEIPADAGVYVYCKMGARSARVVDYLRRHGRERAANIAGGIDAWAEAGLPVE